MSKIVLKELLEKVDKEFHGTSPKEQARIIEELVKDRDMIVDLDEKPTYVPEDDGSK